MTQDDDDECVDPADALLQRGTYLRQLRQLELEDEAARTAEKDEQDATDSSDAIRSFTLSSGAKILSYESYLQHQRYYDDLKHSDYPFIHFGSIGPGKLIMEQDKSLGKGGLCWDAAFILGEYLIHNASYWNNNGEPTQRRILELGCGTGLCGMMVAKAVNNVQVTLTDLPNIMPLLSRNIARNFDASHISMKDLPNDDGILHGYCDEQDLKCSCGTVSGSVLEWGADDSQYGTFDVIVGADVVASLYDPVALARTIHATAHASSIVFVGFKERLSSIHRQFEKEMTLLFETSEIVSPGDACLNRNPNVQILIARVKKLLE